MPVIAETTPAPVLRVTQPSLTAALTTTLAMVDYALLGNLTPTPDAQRIADDLPRELAYRSEPLRAVLAHGTALRSYLLSHLPPEHAGHQEWASLREWLAELSDDQVWDLLSSGVAGVLGYEQPPGTTPTAEEVGASTESFTQHAAVAVAAWGIADAERRARELLDPAAVRATMLELLDAIWSRWLERAWPEQLPRLRQAADDAPLPPAGCGGAQWISLVTGMRPDPDYAGAADRADSVTVMPCPGLGRSLSLFDVTGTDAWVLYSPATTDARSGASAGAGSRVGVAVQSLGSLVPTMDALGDRTRLAIVLHVLDLGPLPMHQLVEALQVHQSTISRQVTTLRKAGLVELDEHRRIVVRQDVIRQACRTLLETLD